MGINPTVGVLQQLPDMLQNLSSLAPTFIIQQIQTREIAALFFANYDDKWQVVFGSTPTYGDLWSGNVVAPSSGGFTFSYTYTLPQFIRSIYILLAVIRTLKPAALANYQATLTQCATRLQNVRDTIVSSGLTGTKMRPSSMVVRS